MAEFENMIVYGDLDIRRTAKTNDLTVENLITTKDLTVSNNASVTNVTSTKDLTVSNGMSVTNTTTTKDISVGNNATITNTTTTKDISVGNNANITNTTTTKDISVGNSATITNTTTTKDLTVSNLTNTKDIAVTNTLDVRNGITTTDVTLDGMGKSLKTILGSDGNTIDNTRIMLERSRTSFLLGNNDWSSLIYSGAATYVSGANGGMQIVGDQWIKIRVRMPVDPSATYVCRARARRVSGTGNFHVGAISLNNSFAEVNTDVANSYNYFAAAGLAMTAGVSTTYEGYISGYNATTEGAHTKFDPHASYFDLIIVPNSSGTGTTIIESIDLFKTFNWLPIPGTLNLNYFSTGRFVMPVGANKYA